MIYNGELCSRSFKLQIVIGMVDYAKLAEQLIHAADDMRAEWDWYSAKIKPRAKEVLRHLEQPGAARGRAISSVASEAVTILANAHMNHIVAPGIQWFKFKSPNYAASEKYLNWYANATEVSLDALARSNLYTELHSAVIDRCLFGTGCMLVEPGKTGGLRAHHIPIGTYGFSLSDEGRVDTLARSFKCTAWQAAQRFGEERLPHEVRQALERDEERVTRLFEFWHLVAPRRSFHAGNLASAPDDMPFVSVYIYASGNRPIVEESGYAEFPYFVTRFLKWGDVLWGYPPGRPVIDDIISSIKLEKNLDFLSDLAAYPRVFIDASMRGEVDFRAGGVTVIPREVAHLNLPREWGSQARVDFAKDRIEAAEGRIRSAFYIPFLQMFSGVDREMTATEARARMAEQVIACSPTFSLFCDELSVLLERVFSILFRQGAYNTQKGSMPQDLVVPMGDGFHDELRTPRVTFHGRINRAIDEAQKSSTDIAMASAAQYVQITGDPAALDCINPDKLIRSAFEAAGAPSDIFRNEKEVEEVRAERRQQQQAAMELQLAQAANQSSQAVRNFERR